MGYVNDHRFDSRCVKSRLATATAQLGSEPCAKVFEKPVRGESERIAQRAKEQSHCELNLITKLCRTELVRAENRPISQVLKLREELVPIVRLGVRNSWSAT